jgi:serine/threonine protein kinase
MALSSGTRLGPYEILAPLGAGGMGEVYRARDTRLDRTVAIKILPAEFSADPERRQRLSREARAISSLSHPNICTLYDVGHQDGTDFLVMEHLEGETLAQRLEKGPLPTEQVLRIGIEIASALARAHRQGIVHRDLKPGNVMLTKSGAKLLDFGLAKTGAAPATSMTDMLTASKPLTAERTVVGTFQYMSPEQIEGREIDARSDLFSFGALLYEMAAGRRAFEGKSQASVMAAILERDPPPMSNLAPLSPPALERLVRVCLAKDPDERWQSAHDLQVQLDWIAERAEEGGGSKGAESKTGTREKLAWGAVLALLMLTAALAIVPLRSRPQSAPLIRSSLLPPADSSFVPYNFAISPDGTRLAFVATGPDGRDTLWVRVLSASSAQQMSGTEEAKFPFWAPDSQRIGFFAEGKLKAVDTTGGAVHVLCEALIGRGGTWNREGTIVFAPSVVGPLNRVSERGGEPVPITRIPRQGSGQAQRWPYFLPDGKHFLYFVDWSTAEDPQGNGIYIGSLDGGASKLLSSDLNGNVAFAAGRLLYVRDRSLVAQPFDPDRAEFLGPAVPVAEQEVSKDQTFWYGGFSVSQEGLLVIQSTAALSTRLTWFDHGGKQVGQLPGLGYWDPRLSPDGRSLVVASDEARNGKYYIHVMDLERGITTRLTDGGSEGSPVWSHDGRRVAYTTVVDHSVAIFEVSADGSGAPQLVVKSAAKLMMNDWSADGHLAFMDFKKGIPYAAIYAEAGREVTPFCPGGEARFSPDGKWVACTEPGGYPLLNIFVQPFPGPGGRIQISSEGGAQPIWSRDGREIYYVAPDRKLMAVAFDSQKGAGGTPRALFQTHIVAPNFVNFQYDVAPDGRFLINSLNPDSPLTLFANWPSLLAK